MAGTSMLAEGNDVRSDVAISVVRPARSLPRARLFQSRAGREPIMSQG